MSKMFLQSCKINRISLSSDSVEFLKNDYRNLDIE